MIMHDELPFVPRDVVNYLKAIYTPDFFINADVDNNDIRMGYMTGASGVWAIVLDTKSEAFTVGL